MEEVKDEFYDFEVCKICGKDICYPEVAIEINDDGDVICSECV